MRSHPLVARVPLGILTLARRDAPHTHTHGALLALFMLLLAHILATVLAHCVTRTHVAALLAVHATARPLCTMIAVGTYSGMLALLNSSPAH